MSDRGSQSQSSTLPYDTNALLCKYRPAVSCPALHHVCVPALYGMSTGLYGAGGAPGAGPGGGGGDGGWWGMAAGQLAVQDYLSRVGAAARDPAQYAALQAQALAQGSQAGSQAGGPGGKHRKAGSEKSGAKSDQNFQHLKLPSDTEIVKSVGGQAARAKGAESDSSSVSIPNIPPGLTIERKKPGRKPLEANYHLPSSGQVIDRVEITKIPLANGSSSAPLDMSSKSRAAETEGEAPLNLSMKSDSDSPLSLTTKRKDSTEKDGGFPASSKIPSDYYACK